MTETSTMQVTTERLKEAFQRMLEIRLFEEALGELFAKNLLGGTSHFCIGQEVCAVGTVFAVEDTDWLVSNHRGHGHLLARGLDPARVMGELLGRRNGYCGGRGGSQHMCAMEHHFLGTNGITGGGIPIGTGAALALKHQRRSEIVVVFFGDGASNQGTFHESLNMASLWKLPVLYVCENNGYGMSNPASASMAAQTVAARAGAYAIPGQTCDGMDIEAVMGAAAEAAAHVRAGKGPALLELLTYRFCGHSRNDPRVYRTREEEARWQQRDGIGLTESKLLDRGVSPADLASLREAAEARIDAAVKTAMAAPCGDRQHALGGVYA
ncbi:MAG: thiamine pyrophosphate-dependent dehydrogenase E1 component subunit alpha [Lentisphaeria bacterium]|nr:thiamine pyrophosphate-dependent dehydrogenase E1 component subunit alpha [Lentisphaeria bacterium]